MTTRVSNMSILSRRRQLTLPKELCDQLHIKPGDVFDFVVHNGRITLSKKRNGASAGVLKYVKANNRISDEESLQNTLHENKC